MCILYIRKPPVGIIAFAVFLAGAAIGYAGLMGVVSVDGGAANSLGSATGSSPTFSFFTTLDGVQFLGGATSNDPGTPSLASLFDASVEIVNNSAFTRTLNFSFTDDTFIAPAGLVSASSHASGTSLTGGVSLDSFMSLVNGNPINHPGLPIALSSNVSYSDLETETLSIASTPFTIGQDYTFTVAAGDSLNFANTLGLVPAVILGPVPEPGTIVIGLLCLGVGAAHRRRNS